MAAIMQIIKSPHLNEKLSNFDKICYTNADLELDVGRDQIWFLFKFKMVGSRHSKSRFWP